jgi:predicted ATPase
MLTRLRLRNFKAWVDTGDIRLAPLTIFFGANSSGKSSINQFLLMLRQTSESPDRQRVFHTGDKKTAVDLGRYPDMVHRHTDEALIGFEIEWSLPSEMKLTDVLSDTEFSGSSVSFAAEAGLQGGRQDPTVRRMGYRLGDPSSTGLEVGMEQQQGANGKYELTHHRYKPVRNPGKPWPLPPPTRFYGFPDEVAAKYQNVSIVRDLTLELEKQLQRIYYLGPLREYPQRQYTWAGERPEHVGWRGERAIDAFLAARERRLSPGRKKRRYPFAVVTARWLKQMGLIESFEVKQIATGRRDFEALVKSTGGTASANLTDVGFGVSQVLPVLVECFYATHGSTIIMEQPEIHLHPSVQASLADLFIEAVHAWEGGRARGIQLLIESHSEHFLRRLQRGIAEEAIDRDSVAIYVCRSTPSGSRIDPLDVDLYGNITNWPDNFFGDEVEDLRAMTEAAARRQPAGQQP